MEKPFHLLTPAERTALRIAQNRVISEKVEEKKRADEREGRTAASKPARKSSAASSPSRVAPEPPPAKSTTEFLRATPEERGRLGSFIRKVQS